MAAGVYDFEVEQGTSFKLILQWKNNGTGVPYDLTGCEIRMQVRKAQQQPVLLEVTTTNGKFVITDAANGTFQMLLSAADTSLLTSKEAVYDIEVAFPDGPPQTVIRVLKGRFLVDPNITQIAGEPVLS